MSCFLGLCFSFPWIVAERVIQIFVAGMGFGMAFYGVFSLPPLLVIPHYLFFLGYKQYPLFLVDLFPFLLYFCC